MTVLHMGSLHAIEVVLVVVLAVGPFLALAGAIVIARRRDRAELEPADEKQDLHPSGQPSQQPSQQPSRQPSQQEENSWC